MEKRSGRTTLSNYNATIRAIKSARGISHAEAQQTWRGLKANLGRAPKTADVKRHSRIVAREAKRAAEVVAARKEEKRAEKAARQRKLERIIERVKAPKPARQKKEPRDGGRADRGGGGADGGAGGAAAPAATMYDEYDEGMYEYYDVEDPIEDTGEAAE